MAAVRFKKFISYISFAYYRVIKNQHFKSTPFGGREGAGLKKSSMCSL